MEKDKEKQPQKQKAPVKPEKYIPAKPDENPDSTKHAGNDPEKNDHTRIDEFLNNRKLMPSNGYREKQNR
jgi:hypothetical protein